MPDSDPVDSSHVDLVDSLRAAERRLQAAQRTSDVEALTALLHDDVRFTGPDGTLLTKADDLHAHQSGAQVIHRVDEEDLQVFAMGATGVTWFLGTLEVTVAGERLTARARYTRTWLHTTNWQVIAAHATIFPN